LHFFKTDGGEELGNYFIVQS